MKVIIPYLQRWLAERNVNITTHVCVKFCVIEKLYLKEMLVVKFSFQILQRSESLAKTLLSRCFAYIETGFAYSQAPLVKESTSKTLLYSEFMVEYK